MVLLFGPCNFFFLMFIVRGLTVMAIKNTTSQLLCFVVPFETLQLQMSQKMWKAHKVNHMFIIL